MKPKIPKVPASLSIKLSEQLRVRVARAMYVKEMKTKADFFRTSAVEMCRRTEIELKRDKPEEYARIYGKG